MVQGLSNNLGALKEEPARNNLILLKNREGGGNAATQGQNQRISRLEKSSEIIKSNL